MYGSKLHVQVTDDVKQKTSWFSVQGKISAWFCFMVFAFFVFFCHLCPVHEVNA